VVPNAIVSFLKSHATLSSPIILVEEFVEELRPVMAIVVERQRTTSMLVVMNVVNPNSEQRIWNQEEPWYSTPRLNKVKKASKEQ